MNKSILVTGSTGYIGAYIAQALSSSFKVYVLNRRIDYLRCSSRQIFLKKNNEVEINKDFNIYTVIHCMGLAHNKFSFGNKILHKINVDLTIKIAKECIKVGINKFIFISTANIYDAATPDNSIDNNLLKNDCYSYSKFKAEIALKELFKSTNIKLIILRPPLVYGKEKYKGNLRIIELLIKFRLPLPIGLLSAKRSYLSLENLCRFILVCVNNDFNSDEPFFLMDNKKLNLKEISEMISTSIAIECRIINVNLYLVKIFVIIFLGRKMLYKLLQNSRLNQNKTLQRTGWRPLEY